MSEYTPSKLARSAPLIAAPTAQTLGIFRRGETIARRSSSPMPTAALAIVLLAANESRAQASTLICDPDVGRDKSRIECLAKIVRSLSEQLASLQAQLSGSAKSGESPRFVTSSELDARLGGYVKYGSPLAINLLAEPSATQNDGRCLEGFSGEVGVIAHRPCDFEGKEQLQWRLLPVIRKEGENP